MGHIEAENEENSSLNNQMFGSQRKHSFIPNLRALPDFALSWL